MSPYNEFRLRRLVGGLLAAEFGVECWEKAKYTPWRSWNLDHAKAYLNVKTRLAWRAWKAGVQTAMNAR